jgi:hypothetical protein
MADASTSLEPDVIINVHKGLNGYGIYFGERSSRRLMTSIPSICSLHTPKISFTRRAHLAAQREEGMVVTKLDPGSEAEKAGVQPGDRLVQVQDNDLKLPPQSPGQPVLVTRENYSAMHLSHEQSIPY